MNTAHVRLIAASAIVAATLTACDGDPTGDKTTPGIRVVSGAGSIDTVDALVAPVVVEVRRANGELANNIEVRMETSPPYDGTGQFTRRLWVCAKRHADCGPAVGGFTGVFVLDTTDAAGRVTARVRFSAFSGPAYMRVTVPTLGFIDSVPFTINPGNANRVRADLADTAMAIGSTLVFSGAVLDRRGNVRTEVPVASAGAGPSLTVNTQTRQVSAQQFGVQNIYFTYNALRDSTVVRVVPAGRIVATVGNMVTLFNTDGSAVRILSGSVGDLLGQPRFGPTRQRIIHTVGDNLNFSTRLAVVDTSGSPRRDIDTVRINSILVTREMADGSLLTIAQRTPTVTTPEYRIFRIGTDNSLTIIRDIPALAGVPGSADISPDGSLIAYGVVTAPTNTYELRIMNVATGVVRVGEPRIGDPRFTRQGDRILFNSQDGLAIVNTDLTGRRLVVPRSFFRGAIFSPDEAYVIGNAFPNGNLEKTIHIVRVSDNAIVPVKIGVTRESFAQVVAPDWR